MKSTLSKQTTQSMKKKGIQRPFHVRGHSDAAKARRFWNHFKMSNRRHNNFRYGEDRTCVLTSGETFSWKEQSCGHTWIAMHVAKSYCVVVVDSYPERSELINHPKSHPSVSITSYTLLLQMHVTASALNQKVAQRAKRKPYAVVSVAPENVGVEGGYELAIDFLKQQLIDCPALTGDEIHKIIGCALKYLFGPEFKSDQLPTASYEWGSWNGRFGKMSPSDVDEWLKALDDVGTTSGSAIGVRDGSQSSEE